MDLTEILFNNISSAVVVTDEQMLVVKCNKRFNELFDIKSPIINTPIGDLMGCFSKVIKKAHCGFDEKCISCSIRNSVRDLLIEKKLEQNFFLTENFIINGSLVTLHLDILVKQLHWENRDMAVIIINDITELENKRKELEQINQNLRDIISRKNEFLGIAVHDLRNPLSLILSATNYIMERTENQDEEAKAKMIDAINKTSRFSLELVNELLDVSAIETGNFSLQKEKLDYGLLINEIVENNRIIAYKKGISIDFINNCSDALVNIDPKKITQVVNNLLSNAIKYSFPFTQIAVEIKRQEGHMLTFVRDEGQGIPEQEQGNIFEAFTRTSVKTTSGEKSTGLGLKIVKDIIKAHGGEIKLKSQPGQGSEFVFSFPV